MKKLILLLNCILNVAMLTAGFTGDTLVNTPKGLVALQNLQVGDNVVCFKGDGLSINPIESVQSRKVADFFKVVTHGGDVIYSSSDARFYMPKEQQWNNSCDLRVGSWLLQQNLEGIKVKQVEKIINPTDIYDIGVNKYHNFGVSGSAIVVHNMDVATIVSIIKICFKNMIPV